MWLGKRKWIALYLRLKHSWRSETESKQNLKLNGGLVQNLADKDELSLDSQPDVKVFLRSKTSPHSMLAWS